MRADDGRLKGEGGGMVTVCSFGCSLGSGAVMGGSFADSWGSCLMWSQLLQLLALEVAGVDVTDLSLSAGPDVKVKEPLDADEVTEAIEVGLLPWNTNFSLVPVDIGLMRTGDRVLRKSR